MIKESFFIIFQDISKSLTKILKENEKYNGIVKEMINKLTTEVELSKKDSPVCILIYRNLIANLKRMSQKLKPK